MRWIQAVVLIVLFAAGCAWGQTSATHTVSVRIPNILRLRIGEGPGVSQAETAIRVHVRQDDYRIDPASTEVQVLANSRWQLAAHYLPASQHDAAAKLLWKLDDGNWHAFATYDRQITQGSPTGGWHSLTVTYGLDESLPAPGNYEGVITYTLTRP